MAEVSSPWQRHPRTRAGRTVEILDRARPIASRLTRGLALDLLVAGALALLAFALRLWDIARYGFWGDELVSLSIAAVPLGALPLALMVEPNMTLYQLVLSLWVRVVGLSENEAAIRGLSAALGAAAVPLIYLLGRRIHSRRAGLAAAGLLAASSFHAMLSQEARGYGLFSLVTLLSYVLLDSALRRSRRRTWALLGGVLALACYSHTFAVFTIAAQGLFVLGRRSWAALRGFCGSLAVCAVLVAPLLPLLAHHSGMAPLAWLRPPSPGDFARLLMWYSGGSWAALVLAVGLVAVALAASARPAGGAYRAGLLLTWLLVPPALAFGLSAFQPIFRERYLIAAQSGLILLMGLGLASLPRVAALPAFVVATALSIQTLYSDVELRRPQEWPAAVARATATARPGDGWIFIAKWGQNAFEYYAGWGWGRDPSAPYADVLHPFDWREAYFVPEPEYHALITLPELEVFARPRPRIWLVLNNGYQLKERQAASAPVRNWLEQRGYRATQADFRGVRLLLYERRTG